MAGEKVTKMELNVDLQYSKCYKRVKQLLCKFPEIRDQQYDEKANKVTIKVVSCSPEKIRDKLRCKGGGCIKSIKIIPPSPPPTPPPPPPPPPKKVSVDIKVEGFCYCKCCSERPRGGPCSCGRQVECVLCYCKCCSGRPWGPCSCGGQVQCVLCHGRPVCDSWCGYGSGWEETQPGCSIM